ncbi:MAG: tRNA (adenosine(37)-N6)-dimethylallyltransferase MiaA [Elusimicrobiales bacterium]
MEKPIVLMGPTASGKTDIAIALAKACGGEIISADSRQIYAKLSAGTAKPPGQWVEKDGARMYLSGGVPYHLVDFLDPRSSYDAGSFAAAAAAAEAAIRARGARPVFAGGTGLYLQAYWNGMDALPKGDSQLRLALARLARELGPEGMHARLRGLDPQAAEKIPAGNIQRVIRAMEVRELTGIPISQLWSGRFYDALPTHKAVFFVLDWSRDVLRERIAARTHKIFDAMASETDALLQSGYPEDCPALKSLGYPQAVDYLRAKAARTDTIHRIITLTQAYAKRQITWLRRYKNIRWISLSDSRDWTPEEVSGIALDNARAL